MCPGHRALSAPRSPATKSSILSPLKSVTWTDCEAFTDPECVAHEGFNWSVCISHSSFPSFEPMAHGWRKGDNDEWGHWLKMLWYLTFVRPRSTQSLIPSKSKSARQRIWLTTSLNQALQRMAPFVPFRASPPSQRCDVVIKYSCHKNDADGVTPSTLSRELFIYIAVCCVGDSSINMF